MLSARTPGTTLIHWCKRTMPQASTRILWSKKELGMRLSELREGQTGIVDRVQGDGAVRRRILEMGILKGAEIYVEKYAPLKDPLELIVKGYHISLRVKEANQITVEKVK